MENLWNAACEILWKLVKFLLKLYVLFLFLFFSCSPESSLDVDPQVEEISVKIKRQKWEKSSPKNKNDRDKSIAFSVKTFFAVVFAIIWQKKTRNLG